MFTPCIKISWNSNKNWLHRNLSEFSIVHSMNNWPSAVKIAIWSMALELNWIDCYWFQGVFPRFVCIRAKEKFVKKDVGKKKFNISFSYVRQSHFKKRMNEFTKTIGDWKYAPCNFQDKNTVI